MNETSEQEKNSLFLAFWRRKRVNGWTTASGGDGIALGAIGQVWEGQIVRKVLGCL